MESGVTTRFLGYCVDEELIEGTLAEVHLKLCHTFVFKEPFTFI